jgi:uncharacterized protein (DUF924 family)
VTLPFFAAVGESEGKIVGGNMDGRPKQLLDFWLGDVGEARWYAQDDALDAAIRERWLPVWEEARAGGLDGWRCSPRSTLALLVLLDQFPRNMFRGDARSFATDARARKVAKEAILRGFDSRTPLPERQFYYLPLEHSELPADQDRAVRLMLLAFGRESEMLRHARAHREIIRRFGRFPYRNAVLGRESRPEETAFLAEGGYRAALESTPV